MLVTRSRSRDGELTLAIRWNSVIALLLSALALTACAESSADKVHGIEPSVPTIADPTPTMTFSPSPSPATSVLGSATGDLRRQDWGDIRFPGDFCHVPGLVQLQANAPVHAQSSLWGPVVVSAYPEDTVYGDLTGDSRVEAGVPVYCDNGGSTEGSLLAGALLIVTQRGGNLVLLGTVTPQYNPPGEHRTVLSKRLVFKRGSIRVTEIWYRPNDSNCCGSGRATTLWRLHGDVLTPGQPDLIS